MRILWLKSDLLHPIDKGGKIRSYQMLRLLKRSCHITYLAMEDGTSGGDAKAQATEYCHEALTVPHAMPEKFTAGFYGDLAKNLLSPFPYAVQKYRSAAYRRAVSEQLARGAHDLLVCDFLFPAVNLPPRLPCPSVLFQHNVEALIWQRHVEAQTNPIARRYVELQRRRMDRFERAACRRFDCVVAVSAEDRALIERLYGLPRVEDVPTGVDTDYFRPTGAPVRPHRLVFTGSMDWLPNDDAIRHFTQEILPLVRREIPDVSLAVVGRKPFPPLVDLSRRDPHVIVTGRVDDVRPYMEEAAVYVVPIRIGGGTRLKVFEAMAMEKPVVSTSVGVEGLPVAHGEDVLVADDPRGFAGAVIHLLRNEAFARELAQRAATKVRREFGWERAADRFAEICSRTVTDARTAAPRSEPLSAAPIRSAA
jgi:polysaccharide biosynthesis protein PslH